MITTPYNLSSRCYVATPTVKTTIVLHGSFSRTKHSFTGTDNSETGLMQRWNLLEDRFAGHYVIGRSGIIYSCVDEDFWVNQTALHKSADVDRHSIGIFLCNELYLRVVNGKNYAFAIDKPHNLYTGPTYQYTAKGYHLWADYDEMQINMLCNLLEDICSRHDIQKAMPKDTLQYSPGITTRGQVGIVSHANLNPDSYSLPLPTWALAKLQDRGIDLI